MSCTDLTLTLTPGLHYGPAAGQPIDFLPSPDISPAPVVMQLPLYPKAAPSTIPLRQPFIEYPASP